MSSSSPEDTWHSFRELKVHVWKYLSQKPGSNLPSSEFENVLIKYKQHFFSLLQYSPRNAAKREELKNGMVEGIDVRGIGRQILTRELYHECILLSDLFNLNELVALDLLCQAQLDLPYYPDFSRPYVAVLLYYDAQKTLLTTLHALIQSRFGVQWCISSKIDLCRFVTDYTDDLMEGGIFEQIFDILQSFDLTIELTKLHQHNALGNAKHRRLVTDLINDIRFNLTQIVFAWGAQSGLPKAPTLSLINYLRQIRLEAEATGIIDKNNLYLLMALLYSLDLSILHTIEDGDEAVQGLPVLSDTTFIGSVVNEILGVKTPWACQGLQAVVTLTLSVCLASLRVVSQNYIFQESLNKEDALFDLAMEMNVFTFMHNNILENYTIYEDRFLGRRIHNLLTDMVVYMYPKMKELRMKANEVSRTLQVYLNEGMDAPAHLPRYFEYLMLCIGKFYIRVKSPMYTLTWWSSLDQKTSQSQNIRSSPRSVALFKFIKLTVDMIPSSLITPFIKMLSGLSTSKKSAKYCFEILKAPGLHITSPLSWEHFFVVFTKYYLCLREDTGPLSDPVYRRVGFPRGISPQELEGLHAILLLIRTLADYNQLSQLGLCSNSSWALVVTFLGLVSCPVPVYFKSDLVLTLASLGNSVATSKQMWVHLETSQIIVTNPASSNYNPRGIQTELDEIESKTEEYPLTRAVLHLLDVLTNFPLPKTFGQGARAKLGFQPYLLFIHSSVFLKFGKRSYKDISEKWEIASLCLKLIEKFLINYEPKVSDFPKSTKNTPESNKPPGYHLMLQLNNMTETFELILHILEESVRIFDSYVSFSGEEKVKTCSLLCLKIIHRALTLQFKFDWKLAMTSAKKVLAGTANVLFNLHPRTGKPDYCISIARYVGFAQYLPQHSMIAVKILSQLNYTSVGHEKFLGHLRSHSHRNAIKNGFVYCLDRTVEKQDTLLVTKKEVFKLLKQCLEFPSPNFTQFILGFNLDHLSSTEFQAPGVMGFPRTGLHSLLCILDTALTDHPDVPNDVIGMGYFILYSIVHNKDTRKPVLNFLRNYKQFYYNHLRQCQENMKRNPEYLREMNWLLRTIAAELMIVSESQAQYLRELTSFLVNVPESPTAREGVFLHKMLLLELNELKVIPEVTQPSSPEPKAQKLHAKQVKKHESALYTVAEFVFSWTQVVGAIACCVPEDLLNPKEQQTFCIETILCLLRKIVKASRPAPIVSRLLSECMILMLENIFRHHTIDFRTFDVLDSHIGPLREMFDLLTEWIIVSDVVDVELRMNLYSALTTFLQIICTNTEQPELMNILNEEQMTKMEAAKRERPFKIINDVLEKNGIKLIDSMSNELIGGETAARSLAMTSLSELLTITDCSSLIMQFTNRGCLKHIVKSIFESDKELRDTLEPDSRNFTALHNYTAKMLLLIRIAGSKLGAKMLIDEKLLGVFANMSVYGLHPEVSQDGEDSNDSPESTYLFILTPTFDVCNAILASMGRKNKSAIVQILHYLFAHLDVVERILRSGDTTISLRALKELAQLTSVISRTSNTDLLDVLENPNVVQDYRGNLFRIQRLMFQLVPKFIISDESIRRLVTTKPKLNANLVETSDRFYFALQVASNVLSYARHVIAIDDSDDGKVGAIFYPSLHDPRMHTSQFKKIYHYNEQEISLGLIVQHLFNTVMFQQKNKASYDLLCRKLVDVPEMYSEELSQFVDPKFDILDVEDKRKYVLRIMCENLTRKKMEIGQCSFIIDNAIYIIWAHLDYFLLRAIPNPRTSTYTHSQLGIGNCEVASTASLDVINHLKESLASLFNQGFTKQLIEVSEGRLKTDKSFIETMLRRIKRLIQFANTLP